MMSQSQENYQTQNSHVSRQAAAEELLIRRGARTNLLAFTKYTFPEFAEGEHHIAICRALERVELGECKRLMIFAPPRHTKSELASRRFPAYYLGKHPDRQVISSTYSGEFASDFGRDVRDIVSSPEYSRLFGTRLRSDSTAANRWQTTGKGIYVSVGVGGPITGRGAHLAIIDDPVKNQEDADSETIRNKVWAWYLTTLKTRLMPGGAIILMMTRWHEDDLAGRILREEGDEWEVLSLPAINPKGEALWPEWFPLSELATHQKHARTWQALYMQNPTPEEGTYFKREDIPRHRLGEEPQSLHRYMTSDFAVTEASLGSEGRDPDYTVFGDWGVDHTGKWWLLDRYKDQSSASTWVGVWTSWIKQKGFLKAFGEAGVIRRAVEPFLQQSMRDKSAYCSIEWINRNRDKVAMAAAFRGLCELGKVSIPLTEWGEDVVTNLLKFPAGANDDDVDMCTLLGLAVTQGIAATVPEPEPDEETDGYVSMTTEVDEAKLF